MTPPRPAGRPRRDDLEAQRGRTVPDLVGDDVRLVFVGINPGLWTAAAQAHFAHPGNRFYAALRRAGIIDRDVDASAGMSAEDEGGLTGRGIAITNLVHRATGRADELTTTELRAGGRALVEKLERWRPRVVAVVGITAYRTAFARPRAVVGRQPERLAGAPLWVLPNPSGLNAHETVDSLAAAYREPASAAGIELTEPRPG